MLPFLASSSAPKPAPTATRAQAWRTQFLGPHNAARSAVRLRPLVWDLRLARYAVWYANGRRRDCALVHSFGPYGENIFWGSGSGWTPAQAVAAWVSERKWYRYGPIDRVARHPAARVRHGQLRRRPRSLHCLQL